MKFSPQCGKPLAPSLIEGQARGVCTDSPCDYVFWNNPTPVAAGVEEWNGGIVLVRCTGGMGFDSWRGNRRSESPTSGKGNAVGCRHRTRRKGIP